MRAKKKSFRFNGMNAVHRLVSLFYAFGIGQSEIECMAFMLLENAHRVHKFQANVEENGFDKVPIQAHIHLIRFSS